MADRDWIEVCVSGGELDDESFVELERQLKEAPNDLELRIKRLGFLFMNKRPRAREILWLATHHPEIDLQGFTVFPREEDPEVYEQVSLAWKRVLERLPDNLLYREQAARFASLDDPGYAERLYREGASLQPVEARWPKRLGTLLSRRSRHVADAAIAASLAVEALLALQRAYELESWDFGRHGLQIDIARAAIVAERLDVASAAAAAVLRDASTFEKSWQYGNSIHWAHIVLGQVARRDNPEVACAELALAGRTRGSPQLNSFGPDLTLAQSLLDLGRVDAVVDYLSECKRFWEMDRGLLDQWIGAISSGVRPRLNKV